MATGTLTFVETYETVACCECGVKFALAVEFVRERRRSHALFYCPNGHNQFWPQKSEIEKERERAERLADEVKRREADLRFEQNRLINERRAHASTKGQLTKTRKRAANGVCPCCSRTFANVGRHIAGQHPDYAEAHG